MAYLLLLALVYSFAIALLFFQSAVQRKSAALGSFGFGFSLLAFGYAAQIALGFELNDGAARIFYWARVMLALAWLGNGFLLSVVPENKLLRWAGRGLVGASFLALGLVAFTQITNAEDWFQPASTIYSQIGDLLATNRPTRWLGVLLITYGLLTFFVGGINRLKTNQWTTNIRAILGIAGAFLLLAPVYFPSSQGTPIFYSMELLSPLVLLFAIFSHLNKDAQQRKQAKAKA